MSITWHLELNMLEVYYTLLSKENDIYPMNFKVVFRMLK